MMSAQLDAHPPRHAGETASQRNAREEAHQALTGLHSHEALCADRYGLLLWRVGRLEAIVLASAGTLIVAMGGLLITILLRTVR